MLRKALVILSGNAAASLLLLARNLIVARMIPVADYGVAATFAMAMAVVEMASTLGLQQQIVQSKEGDDPRFQAALQGFQLLRGVIAGGVLLALAGPLAAFLGIPQAAWAYQVLALVPVLNAAQHFDIHRLNRQMRFGPLLLTGFVPAAVSLALVWPLSVWMGDWQVMLWSILAQAALGTLTSHLVAERRWRLAWDGKVIAGSLRFGWPLLVNAGLMFLVFQGDKLIVGRVLGMEALAIFAMGVTLTLTPTLVLAKSAQNLFLPRLSALAGTPAFTHLAMQSLQTILMATLGFVACIVLVGGAVTHLLLGTKYAALVPLLVWFALGQALRVMKAGPAIVALAIGQTGNAMAANLVRCIGLPLAALAASRGASLTELLLIAVLAEGAGLIISLWLMLRQADLPAARVLAQSLAGLAGLGAAGFWVWQVPPSPALAPWPVWIAAAMGLALPMLMMRELRTSLIGGVHRKGSE